MFWPLKSGFISIKVEALYGSVSDGGAQGSTIVFPPIVTQVALPDDAPPSSSNNNRLSMFRTGFRPLAGGSFVHCAFRTWANIADIYTKQLFMIFRKNAITCHFHNKLDELLCCVFNYKCSLKGWSLNIVFFLWIANSNSYAVNYTCQLFPSLAGPIQFVCVNGDSAYQFLVSCFACKLHKELFSTTISFSKRHVFLFQSSRPFGTFLFPVLIIVLCYNKVNMLKNFGAYVPNGQLML